MLPFFGIQIMWFVIFFIASPAASSAHLTVSEIFPLEMRSQAMAIFFSCGLGVGGVIAPSLYGTFVSENSKGSIFTSYLLTAFIMIGAGTFGYFFGVDAENKSLEQISKNVNEMDDEEKKALI
jgi:MFS family permease